MSTVVIGPAVAIPLDLAARLAGTLRQAVDQARRDGVTIAPDVIHLVELLDRCRRADAVTSDVTQRYDDGQPALRPPTMDAVTSSSSPGRFIDTSTAANRLGIGEAAVRGRLRRGTLAGHKTDSGQWAVEMETS